MPDDSPKKTLNFPPDVLALADPSVPKIYANGFSLGLTNSDVQVVLKLFGRPIAVLSLSYTLAKTVAQQFTAIVDHWEKRTGQTLQTTQMIERAFVSTEDKSKPQ